MVPISICTSEDAKCCKLKVLLDRPETTITVSGVGPDQWVKVSAPCRPWPYLATESQTKSHRTMFFFNKPISFCSC